MCITLNVGGVDYDSPAELRTVLPNLIGIGNRSELTPDELSDVYKCLCFLDLQAMADYYGLVFRGTNADVENAPARRPHFRYSMV